MSFYSNRRLVDEFDYRDVHVEIFSALMGATCCDLEHEPEKRKCDACGKPIRPIRVHIITVFGNDINSLINVTPLAARRIAEKMIDDVIDRQPDDLDPFADKPADDKPKDDAGDLLLPPDDPDPRDNGRGRGERPLAPTNRLARIADRMKKLGWPLKAANIIRDEKSRRADK